MYVAIKQIGIVLSFIQLRACCTLLLEHVTCTTLFMQTGGSVLCSAPNILHEDRPQQPRQVRRVHHYVPRPHGQLAPDLLRLVGEGRDEYRHRLHLRVGRQRRPEPFRGDAIPVEG